MTHAEFVSRGYEPVYAVTEPYEDSDGLFHVDVCDYDRPKGHQIVEAYAFKTMAQADYIAAKKEEEIAEWGVDTDGDDPLAEHEAREMSAIATAYRQEIE